MKGLSRKLSGHWVTSFGIYTLSNVINAAIPFLLLPLLTQYLSPSDYGILSSVNALINLMIPIIGLNLMTALQVVYVKESMDFSKYISTGIWTLLVLVILTSIILFFFADRIEQLLSVPKEYIRLIAIYAFYQNVVETLLSIWRMQNKALSYGLFRITRTVLELSIAIVLIVVYDFHFDGAIMGLSYSYGIAALLALFIMWRQKWLMVYWDLDHFKHLIFYGGPLVPHVLGGMLMVYADKLVIAHFHGQTENGIYAVGFTVGQLIGLLQNSFNQAWSPWAMQQLKLNDASKRREMVKWTYWYFGVILLITAVFYGCSSYIFTFLGDQFSKGSTMVLFIALGFAFNGMYKMVSIYYFYSERTGLLSLITLVTVILDVVLLFCWVPAHGYLGAAWAMMVVFFLQFITTWIFSVTFIKMPWLLRN
jgi:O-antigen/teichoic acid export membrane protein